MSNRILACLAAAALTFAASSAAAQTAPVLIPVIEAPVAERSPDHDVRAALIRRYFAAIQFDKLMNGMIDGMLDQVLNSPAIPADKRELVRTVAVETYGAVLPVYMDQVVDLYAEEFTVEELEGMVAFYEGPIGRSLTTKSVMLVQRTNELSASFMPVFQAELQRRLCARTDCSAVEGASHRSKAD